MARPKNPDSIPTCPGVYSIWEDQACLYVGAASNLRNRVNQHYLLLRYVRQAHEVKIQYKLCPLEKLLEVEAQIIKENAPILNRAFPASMQVEAT